MVKVFKKKFSTVARRTLGRQSFLSDPIRGPITRFPRRPLGPLASPNQEGMVLAVRARVVFNYGGNPLTQDGFDGSYYFPGLNNLADNEYVRARTYSQLYKRLQFTGFQVSIVKNRDTQQIFGLNEDVYFGIGESLSTSRLDFQPSNYCDATDVNKDSFPGDHALHAVRNISAQKVLDYRVPKNLLNGLVVLPDEMFPAKAPAFGPKEMAKVNFPNDNIDCPQGYTIKVTEWPLTDDRPQFNNWHQTAWTVYTTYFFKLIGQRLSFIS